MVRNMWVTHGMMRAMCQATKREVRVSGRKTTIPPVGLGGGEKKRDNEREKEGEKERSDNFFL